MAMFIETKANENIRADANAAGDYITVTNGYVPDYLFEIGVSGSGTVINVTSGMIVQDGVKVVINAPERVDVGREASGTYEYKLYLKIKMNDPKNPEFVFMRSNITPQKDNVFSNMNAGINHIEIATFTRNTSGVAGLKKTLKKSETKLKETPWLDLRVLSPFVEKGQPAVKRIGNVVYWKGNISRPTGFSATDTDVLENVPLGYRPTTNVLMPPGTDSGGNIIFYNGQINSEGRTVLRQKSAAGTWFGFGIVSYVTNDPFPQ